MAMANTAGSTPRRTRVTHHATARLRSARGSAAKNFHSWRSKTCRNRLIFFPVRQKDTGYRRLSPFSVAGAVSAIARRLQLEQLRVPAAGEQQLVVGAELDDAPGRHDRNPIGDADG